MIARGWFVSSFYSRFLMNTKLFLLSLLCLLCFAGTGQTQERNITKTDIYLQLRDHYASRDTARYLRIFWDDRFAFLADFGGYVRGSTEVFSALGFSDKEFKTIRARAISHYQETPEWQKLAQEYDETEQEWRKIKQTWEEMLNESGDLHNVDAETISKLEEVLSKRFKMEEKIMLIGRSDVCRAFENALTPEAAQKLNEMLLAAMIYPMFVPISPHAFEALGLTDAQRQEMAKIKKDLEPELEKYIEGFLKNMIILSEKMDSEFAKLGIDRRRQEYGDVALTEAVEKRLMAEDLEFRRLRREIWTYAEAFTTLYETKVSDVLTDEQEKRLQELFDNPPEHVRIFLNMVGGMLTMGIDEAVCENEDEDEATSEK